MKNEPFRALKIGVSSKAARRNRIKSHIENGWEVVKIWDVADAGLAEAVETTVLNYWRTTVGAPIAMRRDDMPQGGYSETVALMFVDEDDAIRVIEVALVQLLG